MAALLAVLLPNLNITLILMVLMFPLQYIGIFMVVVGWRWQENKYGRDGRSSSQQCL
jgi:hypothetical protein